MLCERKGRANFVKILDFGLAKLLRGEQAITEEHVMGTVGYLAPEAIKGEQIDLRVDVYAIGILFYYMLAGRLPFEGESNAAVFYKTINEQPRDLGELLGQNHGLPRGLVELVHQCLEKDRNARPADADRVVERLIDVVPASLFRLPRATTERHGVPVNLGPGVGNTGLMELVGADHSPSHELQLEPGTPTPPPGTLRPISSPLPAAAATETGRSALINVDSLEGSRRTMSLVAISVVAGALAAIVVAGGVLMLVRDDEPRDLASASAAPSTANKASDASPTLAAMLDEIDARIGRGDLDGAAAALDRIRDQAKGDTAAFARVELAEKHIRIARLLADAAARETEGDVAAAIVGYRDILALDPKHAPARAALARLESQPEPAPVVPAAPGVVQISSRPQANLYIDGKPRGTTPFGDKLPKGRHKLKLTARGYHNWEGVIEVGEDGAPPVAVTLRGKGSGKGGSDPSPTNPPDPVPSSSPPSSPPEPSTSEPARQPDKKDPFLPTKPKAKPGSAEDPFLPTKKP
jgi:hypothetical protein